METEENGKMDEKDSPKSPTYQPSTKPPRRQRCTAPPPRSTAPLPRASPKAAEPGLGLGARAAAEIAEAVEMGSWLFALTFLERVEL